jgi:hypothetical protein
MPEQEQERTDQQHGNRQAISVKAGKHRHIREQ